MPLRIAHTSGKAAREPRPLALPTLDGWRAIAISMVIVSHGADGLLSGTRLSSATEELRLAGLLGVQIFFGLSGFLITSRLLHEESRRGHISLRAFYRRRFFRIIPPAAVFLVALGALALAGLVPLGFTRWLSSLLCFANYSRAPSSWYVGHFWSLAIEEHFYLLWPSAFLLLATVRRRTRAAAIAALLLALWRAVDFKFRITGSDPAHFWGRTDIQGDGLLWGVCTALVAADATWGMRLRALVRSRWIRLALAALVLALGFWKPAGWKLALSLVTVKAIAVPVMIFGTVFAPGDWFGRLLESPPFRWIGALSYSIYLWQQLFFAWHDARVPALRLVQAFPANLGATLLMAILSYYVVERPMIAVGRHLGSERALPTAIALSAPQG
ncbi:MAG TPA: acyltransferase [Anaeromyxobacteraceae bacterium]|nr:acyltransferase [Anaeromyxobacteraceae bacterium]